MKVSDEGSRTPAPEPDALESWPPRGFNSYYTVTERIDDRPELTYDLVLPGTFSEVDLATVRIGRHGGPNASDLQFRAELHQRIGAVAVAAGHVEMAMKRLLLVMTAPSKASFSTVDETWSSLHKKLMHQCDGKGRRRQELVGLLKWGEEQGIKGRRDNVIHADWWEYAGCGARGARFARGSNGTTILASLADLEEDARLLSEYAYRLDSLLGKDWMMARLPGPFRLRKNATSLPLQQSSGS
jgi:hypothetical protein